MSKLKVSKPETKTQVKVILNIQPGTVSAAAMASWAKFWKKLIAEAKNEVGKQSLK